MGSLVSDSLFWQVLDRDFCSYKFVIRGQDKMCRHPMNVDGLCRETWCPLANSKYATVIEERGKVYLCIKTPERAHLPSRWWEKIRLNIIDKKKGLQELEENLQWWDNKVIRRCRHRFLRIVAFIKRKGRLLEKKLPQLQSVKRKEEKRLRARESKAVKIAKIETKIEEELMNRLKKGVYGDLYDFDKKEQEKEKMDTEEEEGEIEEEDAEMDEAEPQKQKIQFVADVEDVGASGDANEGDEDDEDASDGDDNVSEVTDISELLERENSLEDIMQEYEKVFGADGDADEDGEDDEDDEEEEEEKPAGKEKRKHLEIEYDKKQKKKELA